MPHHRVGPVTGEGLGGRHFIGKLRGEIAERFQAVGQGRVALVDALQRVGGTREAAVRVGPHDNGVGFAAEDFVAVDHRDDRLAGLAFGYPRLNLWVAGLVVDHGLAGGGTAGTGQAHFLFGQGVSIGAPTFGHHHHLAEQAIGDVAGVALAAERGTLAGGGERAFALGVEGVAAGSARGDQEVAIAAGVGGNVADAVDGLKAVDLKADVAISDLLVGDEVLAPVIFHFCSFFGFFGFIAFFGFFSLYTFELVLILVDTVFVGIGLISQQVGQVDRQAITDGNPQHDGTWAFVRAQGHLARHCGAPLAQGYQVLVHHILTQGEHHAVGVLRAKAVEHQWLVQGDHVGHQGALALHSRLAGRCPAQQGEYK
ncbi:hypothetical protein D3C78_416090 [compost metagenome]